MGQQFRFRCTSCRYYADVGGGEETGMECTMTTIVCVECRVVRDVVTRTWINGDYDAGTDRPIRCTRRARHTVRVWQRGDACPKCGSAMSAQEGTIDILWD